MVYAVAFYVYYKAGSHVLGGEFEVQTHTSQTLHNRIVTLPLEAFVPSQS